MMGSAVLGVMRPQELATSSRPVARGWVQVTGGRIVAAAKGRYQRQGAPLGCPGWAAGAPQAARPPASEASAKNLNTTARRPDDRSAQLPSGVPVKKL